MAWKQIPRFVFFPHQKHFNSASHFILSRKYYLMILCTSWNKSTKWGKSDLFWSFVESHHCRSVLCFPKLFLRYTYSAADRHWGGGGLRLTNILCAMGSSFCNYHGQCLNVCVARMCVCSTEFRAGLPCSLLSWFHPCTHSYSPG